MFHGMDLELKSAVHASSFPPSKVELDLVHIRHSFLSSHISFDVKERRGHYYQAKIKRSNRHQIGIITLTTSKESRRWCNFVGTCNE